MKILRYLPIAALLLALVPGVALAGNHQHETSGVQVDIPDNWSVEDDEDSLGAVAPDESVAVVFLVLEAETLDAALEGLDEALGEMFDELELDEEGASEMEVNGLSGLSVSGTASSEDGSMQLGVALIDTDSEDHILMVLAMAEEEVEEAIQKQTIAILQSIRPILETVVHAAGGICFDVPFDWEAEAEDDMLTVGPKEGLALMFWMLDADSLEDALAALEDELDAQFDDWAMDEDSEEEFTVNGLAGIGVEGEALYDGHEIDLGVALIVCPSGKVMVIAGVAARGHWEQHEGTVAGILQSIRKN